jgi:fructose-1,6-bisphosphatase/inositol monophosphatase family enzyme
MDGDQLLEIGREVAVRVREALSRIDDWGPAGTRPGQYRSDIVADEAALAVLLGAGLGVLSEESGLHEPERELRAVVDPVDGSTNASRGIPWFATSTCILDAEGPLAAVVVNQASGTRYEAVRGGGATRDGERISPSGCRRMSSALIGLSGFPRRYLGWKQFRALGAAALDACAVADGTLDAYADLVIVPGGGAHAGWDYLGGMLVCREAGAAIADAYGRDLVVREFDERRTPLAAANEELLAELLASLAPELAGSSR